MVLPVGSDKAYATTRNTPLSVLPGGGFSFTGVAAAITLALSMGVPSLNIAATPSWQFPLTQTKNAFPWTTVAYADQVEADTTEFVICPRPDSETSTYARHRWAHSQMDYKVPLGVRGGRFSYHFEVDTTNTDLALSSAIVLGADYTPSGDYEYTVTIAAVSIAALTAGAHNIYIKGTDHDGDEIKIWWSVTKDDSHFFFVDKTTTGSLAGTFDDPFDNLNEAGYLASGDGASAAGKVLVIKEADSVTTPYTKTAGWNFSSSAFPCGIISIPGEQPVIDLEGTKQLWGWSNGTSNDFFIGGIKAINGDISYTTSLGSHGAFASEFGSSWDRATIWNCVFDGVSAWPHATNNNSFIMFNNASTGRLHVTILGNTFSNSAVASSSNEGAPFMMDGLKNFLCDKNIADNLSGNCVCWSKRNIGNVSIRRWTAYDAINITQPAIDIRLDNLSGDANDGENLEICFNNIKIGTSGRDVVEVSRNATNVGVDGPHHIYKNTLLGGAVGREATNHTESCATGIFVDQNITDTVFAVIVGGPTAGNPGCTPPTPTLVGNKEGVDVATEMNADQTVTDAYLTAQGLDRGDVGHELFSA